MAKRTWGRIEFKFKTDKNAYRFAFWLSMGKELGIVPATIEIQYSRSTVVVGHWASNSLKDE